jgi:hypothetical protein
MDDRPDWLALNESVKFRRMQLTKIEKLMSAAFLLSP